MKKKLGKLECIVRLKWWKWHEEFVDLGNSVDEQWAAEIENNRFGVVVQKWETKIRRDAETSSTARIPISTG